MDSFIRKIRFLYIFLLVSAFLCYLVSFEIEAVREELEQTFQFVAAREIVS